MATLARLHSSVKALPPDDRPDLDPLDSTLFFWSLVHGVSQLGERLTASGLFARLGLSGSAGSADALVQRFVRAVAGPGPGGGGG